MQSKRSKHSRQGWGDKASDLQIRSFPAYLRLACKRAALDNGMTLRAWFISGCERLIAEERRG